MSRYKMPGTIKFDWNRVFITFNDLNDWFVIEIFFISLYFYFYILETPTESENSF